MKPHHYGLSVPDLEASIAWYCTNLGFTLEARHSLDAIPAQVAFLLLDDFRIELFAVENAAPLPEDRRVPDRDLRTHGNKHMAYATKDLPALLAALKKRGVDVVFQAVMHGTPIAFVRDNTGNLIELVHSFDP